MRSPDRPTAHGGREPSPAAAPRDAMPADGLPPARRRLAFLAIALGITMAVLDGSLVNVALPGIARALGVDAAASVWIVNAYQLAVLTSLLPLAALGERLGYRRVFVAGLATFTAGSLACALADSLGTLVASRALQGLGAGGVMSVNAALLRHVWPRAMLGRGIGWNTLVVSVAAAAGPPLAAGTLAVADWPWLFAINLPVGVAGVALARRCLPGSERSDRPFDLAGAALAALGLGLAFAGVDRLGDGAAGAVPAAWTLVAALGVGAALVAHQRARAAPLVPLDLLAIPPFALAVAGSVCAFAAWSLAFVALPFHLQGSLGLDQVRTGLLMTPWPVALGLLAPLAGRLSDRADGHRIGALGTIGFAAGLLALALLPGDAGAFDVAWRTALCGAGFALFQAPNNRTMLSVAPRERSGAAGGLLAVARTTGLALGAALAALAFALAPDAPERVAFGLGAGFAVAAGAASAARGRRDRALVRPGTA